MKIILRQRLGKADCPYLVRWGIDCGLFTIRLHHWLASDDQRFLHDHPWWFLTLVLWGSYQDISADGVDRLRFGSIRFRRAKHRHSVKVPKRGCWTLLLTGRERRVWGFWVNGRFRKRNKYFYEYGHHPCEEVKQ